MSLRVLQIHNRYLIRGGEDTVVQQEGELFRELGHIVGEFIVGNDMITDFSASRKARLALGIVDSDENQRALREYVEDFKPDVAHVYNTFPLLRFGFIEWLMSRGIPVVLAISNYRAGCLNAEYFRKGMICRLCDKAGTTLPGVALRCYHGSLPHSFGGFMFSMEFRSFIRRASPQLLRVTYLNTIQAEMLRRLGADESLLFYKPNFLRDDPGIGSHLGDYALFAGRLTEAKGVGDLLTAWKGLSIPLKVAGDGAQAWLDHKSENTEFLGAQDSARISDLMRNARFLVFASKWFEGMPMVLLEAMAAGLPVVVPDIEPIISVSPPKLVGWAFDHKNPVESIASAAQAAAAESSEALMAKSGNARRRYIELYSKTAQSGYIARLYKGLGISQM